MTAYDLRAPGSRAAAAVLGGHAEPLAALAFEDPWLAVAHGAVTLVDVDAAMCGGRGGAKAQVTLKCNHLLTCCTATTLVDVNAMRAGRGGANGQVSLDGKIEYQKTSKGDMSAAANRRLLHSDVSKPFQTSTSICRQLGRQQMPRQRHGSCRLPRRACTAWTLWTSLLPLAPSRAPCRPSISAAPRPLKNACRSATKQELRVVLDMDSWQHHCCGSSCCNGHHVYASGG